MLERHLRDDRENLPVTLFLFVLCFFFTPKLIRFFVKVSFKKVSFWEILLISALDININVDDTSTVLQFASSFQLLVLDTFDSCRKCQLRYICDLHIIHHYLYKKCTCFCNKVHHKRKTKPYIDRFITAVILVVIAVKLLYKFQFNQLQMTFRALFAHAR